ncbi:MAG: winged helix-turn-helix domain-containing protein, partial [Clostridia bacterium]|nr:winged helix-turn-helix domain-containing protein [Clostridia bacterium]
MGDTVRITMMGSFLIYINEQRVENPVSKSRKGTALMEYLVLHRGRSVPNQQLLHALWPEHSVSNPENALKTLVSRMRTLLNQMSEGLGSCIVSDRGAYHWQSLPGMRIDALELMELFDAAPQERDPAVQRGMYQRIMELYKGDLFQTGDLDGDTGFAQQLHTQ